MRTSIIRFRATWYCRTASAPRHWPNSSRLIATLYRAGVIPLGGKYIPSAMSLALLSDSHSPLWLSDLDRTRVGALRERPGSHRVEATALNFRYLCAWMFGF